MAETPYITKPQRPWAKVHHRLDLAALAAILLGITALLLEFGFYRLPLGLTVWMLDAVLAAVALGLLVERIARWAMAPDRRGHLKHHWGHAALPVASVAAGMAWAGFPTGLLLAARLYLGGTIIVRGVSLYARAIGSGMHPARLLAGSFLFGIVVGTGLLMLPRAVPPDEPALWPDDALFTATSATCVTGLIVLDTGADFSRFGQSVILGLIQLGGLGLMTFGTIFMLLGRRGLGLRHQVVMGEALADEAAGRVARTVKFVILLAVVAEALGAVVLHGLWADRPDGWFYAVFHSISAFCNAGFALQADSFIPQRDTWQVMVAVPALIILGGLGFPVLMDVLRSGVNWLRYAWHRRRGRFGLLRPRWTLHTKIVLATTVLLLVYGTAGLVLCERDYLGERVGKAERADPAGGGDWSSLSLGEQVRQAWFQAVTARTAGFNTIDVDELSPAGKLWIMALMVIGGSPASTAGGFKTVTLAVVILVVWSVLRGRPHVEVFGRTLGTPLLRRTVVLFILYLALVGGATLLLAVVQGPGSSFVDVLFEAVSACGTVGLSLGETGRLTLGGKLVLSAAMYAGRVGPLTLLMSLTAGGGPARYRYPSENLVVG
ncbi:MAG: TrkH family potassium uptake protein [Planctomycetota bacterium]